MPGMLLLISMSSLLDDAIHLLRRLPESMQESAARAVIAQIEEEPGPGDREVVEQGRRDLARSDGEIRRSDATRMEKIKRYRR